MNPIVWPWMIEVGLVTYRSFTGLHFTPGKITQSKGQGIKAGSGVWSTGNKRPPLPSELLAVMIVFGLFSIVAQKDARIGSFLGWGIVIATGITLFGSPSVSNPVTPASTAKPA